jgi:lipid-A-disaccharide synthase
MCAPDAPETENAIVSTRPLRIAMVAGEASGDILGAGLVAELRQRYPNARFEGIGGPLMLAQGFHSLVPMERLSVMGLVEVLGRLFELIGIRRRLKQYLIAWKPDVFIGIDAPDFNLGLEAWLRQRGILTGHYVSPSVWAWRQKRIFKIARAVDLMLTLFPFEARFYTEHRVPVTFVGHPLADAIPLQSDRSAARNRLGLAGAGTLVALLPGSRAGEIAYIGASFLDAAGWLLARRPDLRFVVPCINEARRLQIESLLRERAPELPVTVLLGHSREVMAASDAVVLASGTATLEAMLMKRPMVVAYRVSPITHWIMKRLLKAPFVALPNLLAGRELVPELIQDRATPENIGRALLDVLERQDSGQIETFVQLHQQLKCSASERAANAVSEMLERTHTGSGTGSGER